MRYIKVPVKLRAGTTYIWEGYSIIPVMSQEEFDVIRTGIGLNPGYRTTLTPRLFDILNTYGTAVLSQGGCWGCGLFDWCFRDLKLAYLPLIVDINWADYLSDLTFVSSNTVNENYRVDVYRGLFIEVANYYLEYGYSFRYRRPNNTYSLELSSIAYNTWYNSENYSGDLQQSVEGFSGWYGDAWGDAVIQTTPNTFQNTGAQYPVVYAIEDSNNTITGLAVYRCGIGGPDGSGTRLAYSGVNTRVFIRTLLNSADPWIPPEEQDTPYFPENPTDPSQQPTEPQVGPTPGEWVLHEDYIPRLPSPNNDLGLGIMRAYSMDKVQLTGFSNALWSENILTVMKTMLANPLDVVISLMSFPFEIQNYSAAENIQFAWLSQWIPGSCNGNPLTSEIQVINFGQIEVKRYSGTFYDYEPYSSCTLYLPYIGYVSLKVNEILGKTLRLQYIVNLLTGNFTAVIDVDGNPQIISQFQGVIGRPLPLSSGDFFNIVQTTAKIAEGFATGGVAGAMVGLGAAAAGALASTAQSSSTAIGPVLPQTGGGEDGTAGIKQAASLMSKGRKIATFTANAMESVAAASGSIQRAGSIGPVSGRTSTQDAYIILTLPHQNVPENQAILGYPTNLPGPLANYKGYTEVRSIELQADGATDGELAELQDILQGGIVITE